MAPPNQPKPPRTTRSRNLQHPVQGKRHPLSLLQTRCSVTGPTTPNPQTDHTTPLLPVTTRHSPSDNKPQIRSCTRGRRQHADGSRLARPSPVPRYRPGARCLRGRRRACSAPHERAARTSPAVRDAATGGWPREHQAGPAARPRSRKRPRTRTALGRLRRRPGARRESRDGPRPHGDPESAPAGTLDRPDPRAEAQHTGPARGRAAPAVLRPARPGRSPARRRDCDRPGRPRASPAPPFAALTCNSPRSNRG